MSPVALWSWRAGWIALAGLLIVGLPIYAAMPLWADHTLYDLCARNVMVGGVAYRDAWDDNLIGMMFVHVAVRTVFGWSSEAFRLVDFAMISLGMMLFIQWLRQAVVGRAGQMWTLILMLAYWFATPEICHGQRDTWMLVVAMGCMMLRRRQATRLAKVEAGYSSLILHAFGEGLYWGLAIWLKPYALPVAAVVWLASIATAARTSGLGWKRYAMDGVGMLCGGLLAGAGGCGWLHATGAWPYFWEITTVWSPEYLQATEGAVSQWRGLVAWTVHFFPWSLTVWIAVPLAFRSVCRFVFGSRKAVAVPIAQDDFLLAAFTLAWIGQATLLQHPHTYIHATMVFPALAYLAVKLRHCSFRIVGGLIALMAIMAVVRHPLARLDRLALWSECALAETPVDLRDRLALSEGLGRTDWDDLNRVADFLRDQDVADGEVVCFHDSTHPLYLELGIRPAIRYFHMSMILRYYQGQRETIRREINAAPRRFIVGDLRALGYARKEINELPADPAKLLATLPPNALKVYPWNETALYRSGKYVVFEVTQTVPEQWLESDQRPPVVSK